jgi:hypothetical protein
VQLYRYFVSQSSEFCHHNPLCCFWTSVYCCLFRYRLSPETFGYTLAHSYCCASSTDSLNELMEFLVCGQWLIPQGSCFWDTCDRTACQNGRVIRVKHYFKYGVCCECLISCFIKAFGRMMFYKITSSAKNLEIPSFKCFDPYDKASKNYKLIIIQLS